MIPFPFSRRGSAAIAICGLAATALVATVVLKHRDERHQPAPLSSADASAPASKAAPEPIVMPSGPVALRPLPVSRKSGTHEWTDADAKVPEVIGKLVHNPDEFLRMIDENDRIKRRQLVYRNETVPMLMERLGDARLLRSFTLPGLDGKEIEVEVTEIHEEPSLRGGSVIGRVKGRFNSMVSVGYVNGCESFNVISPEDGWYLTADAREPGEVFVKEIDPSRYAPIGGSEPDFILTQQPLPSSHTH